MGTDGNDTIMRSPGPRPLAAWLLQLVVLILCATGPAMSYPSGAPFTACSTLLPLHSGASSMQSGSSPYSVVASSSVYSPGGTIRVTISGSSPFKGFLIQARALSQVAGSSAPTLGPIVGSFIPDSTSQAACLDPASGSAGLTHTTSAPKTSVTLMWNAPSTSQGSIQFVATFVQSFSTFWVQEKSAIVSESRSAQALDGVAPGGQQPAATKKYMDPVLTSDCGKTKSCIYDPPNCVSHGCSYILTWRNASSLASPSAAMIVFELQAANADYVAVGFASGATMVNNSMVVCVKSGSGAIVKQMHSTAFAPPRPVIFGNLRDRLAAVDAKYIRCSFVWNNDPLARSKGEVFDLSQPLYVTLSKGPALPNSMGEIGKHTEKPSVSLRKLTMTSDSRTVNVGARTSINWLVKAHGAIMIVAWVLCGGLGVFLARYYKKMWANKSHCSEKVWLAWHRVLMLMCMFLSIAGVVIIFVYVGGWTKLHPSIDLPQAAHPILGIIAASLAVLNPILAAFRCNPASRKRPIFNWFHWLFGTAAQVFAVVCVFLGLLFPQAQVPGWLLWLFMAFCLFQFLWELIMEIHQCCMYDKNKDKEEMYALEHKGDAKTSEPPYSGRGFKCAMLIIYVIVVAVVAAVMAIVLLVSTP